MSAADGSGDIFATTRWTVIRRVRGEDTTAARDALSQLCQAYWYPLYAYVRRTGASPQDAEDLTQGFFMRLLRLDSLANVASERGKFRAFLLASLKHFLSDQRDFASAGRRDCRMTISLDAQQGETRYLSISASNLTPDQVFDRQWALTLLETVVRRLADDYEAAGRGALFAELRFTIAGGKAEMPYHQIAARLGMTDEAVRVAVHRLRQRYRAALREELTQTVGSEADVVEELRELRRILSS